MIFPKNNNINIYFFFNKPTMNFIAIYELYECITNFTVIKT